jgi:ribonuclease P protein component
MLPSKNRITKASDFSKVLNNGSKNYQESIALYLISTNQPSRLGLIISRRVGNAVKRHLLARQIREVFREFLKQHPNGFDIVVKFSTKFTNPNFSQINQQFKQSVQKIIERKVVEN